MLFRQSAERGFFVPVEGDFHHFVHAVKVGKCKFTALIGRGFGDQYRVWQGVNRHFGILDGIVAAVGNGTLNLGAHGNDQPA